MNKLTMIKSIVYRKGCRGVLLLRKHSPEVLLGIGIVGVVATTVLACRATLKADNVVIDAKDKLDRIKKTKEVSTEEKYPAKEHKRDIAVVYVQTAVDFAILYSPAITLGLTSIACILGAHNIMRRRNVAIIAAYKAVESSFSNYRKRVVEELGPEKDRQFRHGIREELIRTTVEGDNGEAVDLDTMVEVVDPNSYSEYSRFFDESCKAWSKIPGYNMSFLKTQQNHANDILHTRGHLFLNEVYEMLGILHSTPGSITGWVMDDNNDNFVDFGLFEAENEKVRDFVNGYERTILLDFNVDGVIYDKI